MGIIMNMATLEIGMTLDMDVINSKNGAVLIPKNTILTKAHIEKLHYYNVDTVLVKEPKIPEGIKNEKVAEQYLKVEDKLNSAFENVKKGNKFESEKVIEEMNSFVLEISSERDILTQMRLLKKKDDYTFNHSLGVSMLAISLGKWLGLNQEELFDLSMAALFHDMGKLKVDENIVKKPGPLNEQELKEMQKHPIYSYEILKNTNNFNDDVLLGVLQHHEKIDGTGYPYGIKGEQIHDYAKIIAICDVYHAITSKRVYKDKDSPLKAADILRDESFNSLDPYMTQVFLKNISKFYVGNKVLLSNGTTGIIVYIHPQDENKPIVQLDDNNFVDFLQPQTVEILDIII